MEVEKDRFGNYITAMTVDKNVEIISNNIEEKEEAFNEKNCKKILLLLDYSIKE